MASSAAAQRPTLRLLHCALSSVRPGLDCEHVLRPPTQPHPASLSLQHLARAALEVLAHHRQLAARVQLDVVAGDRSDVDDVANPALLHVDALLRLLPVAEQADLLRPHREAAAVPLEHVRDADEAGDELAGRVLVHLGRRPDLLDLAVVEDREAVAHRQRLLLVVRDVDEGDPELLLDPLQLDLQLLAELEVERPERLVEQERLRPVHDRAGERDALALAARELGGLAAAVALELHERERLRRRAGAARPRAPSSRAGRTRRSPARSCAGRARSPGRPC